MPTILFHGDTDSTVNPVNGDAARGKALAGAVGLRTEIDAGSQPGAASPTAARLSGCRSGRPLLERWTVHGAGHAWSGGSPDGSFTEPRGPDASRAMVEFFLAHELARG